MKNKLSNYEIRKGLVSIRLGLPKNVLDILTVSAFEELYDISLDYAIEFLNRRSCEQYIKAHEKRLGKDYRYSAAQVEHATWIVSVN